MEGIGSGTKSIKGVKLSRICDYEHQKTNKQRWWLWQQHGKVSSDNDRNQDQTKSEWQTRNRTKPIRIKGRVLEYHEKKREIEFSFKDWKLIFDREKRIKKKTKWEMGGMGSGTKSIKRMKRRRILYAMQALLDRKIGSNFKLEERVETSKQLFWQMLILALY